MCQSFICWTLNLGPAEGRPNKNPVSPRVRPKDLRKEQKGRPRRNNKIVKYEKDGIGSARYKKSLGLFRYNVSVGKGGEFCFENKWFYWRKFNHIVIRPVWNFTTRILWKFCRDTSLKKIYLQCLHQVFWTGLKEREWEVEPHPRWTRSPLKVGRSRRSRVGVQPVSTVGNPVRRSVNSSLFSCSRFPKKDYSETETSTFPLGMSF